MPKVIYTDQDIEDMLRSGTRSLELNDGVVLTDMAYEKAQRLGLKLVHAGPDNPPAAPLRPYISQPLHHEPQQASAATPDRRHVQSDLQQRIRNAVLSRMGNQVDPALLDVIIQRVLASTGVK